MADPADIALVAAARRGDREAFASLHGRYKRVVHAVLLARIPPRDAEDLVQDVFLVAWRRLRDLHQDEAFGGWLCAIARNAAVDFLRARRLHEPLQDDAGEAPAPVAEAREALEAIKALPEAYRETLLMRLVEGLTGPEIALRTGLTEGSVRVNLHRGMALLRERLAGRTA
jgi:RNA polymerase sigma-70 factor (ECF subfamily)